MAGEMNQPLLHVMIPAYGKSPYLRQTLESATKYLSNEVLITVIEDPSDEANLEQLVKEFPRVSYLINEKRLGIAGNFNNCIDKSTGIFTQICGSDDVFIADPTQYLNNEILNYSDQAVVSFKVSVIDKNNKPKFSLPDIVKYLLKPKISDYKIFDNKKIFSNLMNGDWLYFPAILWKTELTKKYKFSGGFHTAMDLDILIRILADDKKISYVNKKTLDYRRHNQSASSLYAKSEARFVEEFTCHKNAIEIARSKNWRGGAILAQLALTVRLHAIWQALLLLLTNPKLALKILLKALTPIR
jgi:glycosyltransferase involved in cell wall biosynthesis